MATRKRTLEELLELPESALVNAYEAALLLRCAPSTLRRHRRESTGPKYLSSPTNMVRYRAADLSSWMGEGYAND